MMEDFSGLALPPLFGGHILEAELEAAGVELASGATEILESGGPPQDEQKDTRDVDKRKYQALSKRVKELEQVNERTLARLHHVQRLTRRLKKERRFLMKTLDAYRDDYRNAEITIPLDDEGGANLDGAPGGEDDGSSPSATNQSACGVKKKRHRVPKERERDSQAESELCMMSETTFPSPNSLSH
ncbi:TCF3 fusion partner [Ictalurus furcatus]|uniref:TCF3 fusion partner n=1 Tax=Ictalurus furcatus TaxID=66913 RepID=UPI00235098BC|nr:TCF3 fusion partner [Ictalurus furcatus]XP_053470682.1 TCF3 fusion partner [Ictalurus furcatus]XP_053470754.1 TCF3 fusion partner [Ictalurus furcatus]XP_053470838.1 TCF3 fusion partner [Ictalurus furcatus]